MLQLVLRQYCNIIVTTQYMVSQPFSISHVQYIPVYFHTQLLTRLYFSKKLVSMWVGIQLFETPDGNYRLTVTHTYVWSNIIIIHIKNLHCVWYVIMMITLTIIAIIATSLVCNNCWCQYCYRHITSYSPAKCKRITGVSV